MSTSSQNGAIIGGEGTESKLEPKEENLVKRCPSESTPFVFTYDFEKYRFIKQHFYAC